jgi:hypothetical protein
LYLPNAPDWEGIGDVKIFVWRPCEYRVISGGQVGANEGTLRGAIAGIATTGHMPKGFKCVGGLDPEFAAKYNLCETAYGQGSDADRDRQNVAFTRYTMMYAYAGKRQSRVLP